MWYCTIVNYDNKNTTHREEHLVSRGHCACRVHKTFDHLNFSIYTNIALTDKTSGVDLSGGLFWEATGQLGFKLCSFLPVLTQPSKM